MYSSRRSPQLPYLLPHNRRLRVGECLALPALENTDRAARRHRKKLYGRVRRKGLLGETPLPLLIHYQFGMGFAGTPQCRRRRGRIEQEVNKALLLVNRQADELSVFNCTLCSVVRRRDDKITDASPLQLGCAANDGECLGCDTCFKAGITGCVCWHGEPYFRVIMYVILPYKSSRTIGSTNCSLNVGKPETWAGTLSGRGVRSCLLPTY